MPPPDAFGSWIVFPILPSASTARNRRPRMSLIQVAPFGIGIRVAGRAYSPGPWPSRPIFVAVPAAKSISWTTLSRMSETSTRPFGSSRRLATWVNGSSKVASGLDRATGVCAASGRVTNAMAVDSAATNGRVTTGLLGWGGGGRRKGCLGPRLGRNPRGARCSSQSVQMNADWVIHGVTAYLPGIGLGSFFPTLKVLIWSIYSLT